LLLSVFLDVAGAIVADANIGFIGTPDGAGYMIVRHISDPKAIEGSLHVGDRVRLTDPSPANQFRFLRERPGDRFEMTGKTVAGAPLRITATMVPIGLPPPSFAVYELLRLALVLVGLIVVIRRPNDDIAGLLVVLFFGLGVLFQAGAPFYPIWLTATLFIIARVAQIGVAWAALALGTTFPRPSARGLRRWLERANLPYSALCLITIAAALTFAFIGDTSPPFALQALGLIETVAFFIAAAIAFVIGAREATGADRKRVQWVAWSLCVGFSGSLVAVALLVMGVPDGRAYEWVGLTFLAIPFGLGYAIVRHRVVDVGFVVNRALVFAIVSAIVLLAFGALEWLLGNVLVKVSHITSASLELGLALVLGFSLRSIHLKIDAFVDDLFFRDRHRAEHALRTFAREVGYITEPREAIDRTRQELLAFSGSSSVAIYVVAGGRAIRVDASGAAPIGIDDPALVRMRATRDVVTLADVRSVLAGERAFPMTVRDAVVGTIVLGPKANGEAYAPDERATIAAVVIALGNALDALQTAALRTEVARVLQNGAPLATLRRTVDSAAWIDGVVAQPAGSLLGLGE
jgi:MFS family permease